MVRGGTKRLVACFRKADGLQRSKHKERRSRELSSPRSLIHHTRAVQSADISPYLLGESPFSQGAVWEHDRCPRSFTISPSHARRAHVHASKSLFLSRSAAHALSGKRERCSGYGERFIFKFTVDAAIRFSSALYSLMDTDQIDGRSFPFVSSATRLFHQASIVALISVHRERGAASLTSPRGYSLFPSDDQRFDVSPWFGSPTTTEPQRRLIASNGPGGYRKWLEVAEVTSGNHQRVIDRATNGRWRTKRDDGYTTSGL